MPKRLPTGEKAANAALVREIKKYPCLYNCTIPDYARRDVVEVAWERVAESLDDTASNCKDKWRNLRTVFVRKQKARAETRSKGTKPYYLTDSMAFLLPFIRAPNHKLCQSNMISPSPSSNLDGDLHHDSAEQSDADVVEVPISLDDPLTTSIKEENCDSMQSEERTALAEKYTKKQRISAKRSNQEFDSQSIEYNPRVPNKKVERGNARKLFLLSVLPDVENFTDSQYSVFRRKLLDAIDFAAAHQNYARRDGPLSPGPSSSTHHSQSLVAPSQFLDTSDEDSS